MSERIKKRCKIFSIWEYPWVRQTGVALMIGLHRRRIVFRAWFAHSMSRSFLYVCSGVVWNVKWSNYTQRAIRLLCIPVINILGPNAWHKRLSCKTRWWYIIKFSKCQIYLTPQISYEHFLWSPTPPIKLID